jgi:hypothetical protein
MDRLALVDAVGGPLLGLDPLDRRAGPLPVDPLSRVTRLGAERMVGVGDLVGVPVVLDLGRGLAPRPPAPRRLRQGPEGLKDVVRAILLDG